MACRSLERTVTLPSCPKGSLGSRLNMISVNEAEKARHRRRRTSCADRPSLSSLFLLGLILLPASAFQALSPAVRSPLFKLNALALPVDKEEDRERSRSSLNNGNNINTVDLQVRRREDRRREARAYLKQKREKNKASKNDPVAEEALAHKTILASENLDALRARAGVLRRSIVSQQMQLSEIERRINSLERPAYPIALIADLLQEDNPAKATLQKLGRSMKTLTTSTQVLMRKLRRVKGRHGPRNQQWNSVGEFVDHQRKSGVRIVKSLVENPHRLKHLADPETPTLVAHVPAILARLDKLEDHVAPILERVLNNRRHLASVEPYLAEILERFDDIEPHLPWILDNIDALAPYTGLLLKHIDELLLYAEADDDEMSKGTRYDLAEQLLPHLEDYVSHLDSVGPHLPLLRPHVPLLLKHNRIAKISPHIDRLFARGYTDLSASANMDVLLYWFGWSLRIPGLPRLFFALPWSPRIVSFLANRMPKRFVRGSCSGISCNVDNVYHEGWNKLNKA